MLLEMVYGLPAAAMQVRLVIVSHIQLMELHGLEYKKILQQILFIV